MSFVRCDLVRRERRPTAMINVFIFNSLSYLDHGETKITSDNMSRRISNYRVSHRVDE